MDKTHEVVAVKPNIDPTSRVGSVMVRRGLAWFERSTIVALGHAVAAGTVKGLPRIGVMRGVC